MSDEFNIHTVTTLDRGLSYAESCFETFRMIDGEVFEWDSHWQRLQRGLGSFGISTNTNIKDKVWQQCLQAAQATAPDCLIRLTVSGGVATWGLYQTAEPEIYIQAAPFQKKGNMALKTVEYPFSLLPKPAKFTSDYALILRAMQQWDTNHPLMCKDGFIISGLTANIALFVDDAWVTPTGDGILNGTVQQFLMRSEMISSAPYPIDMIATAEAAVLLNSGQFIQTVQSIDHVQLDTQHPAIHTLQQCLASQTGVVL